MTNLKVKERAHELGNTIPTNKQVWREVTFENVRDSYELYYMFYSEIGKAVVGGMRHKKYVCQHEPEKWMTVAEEALAFLAIENYKEKILAQVNNQPPPSVMKYTKNGTAKKNGGINTAGIKRYNELYDYVKAEWQKGSNPYGMQFKRDYQNKGQKKTNDKMNEAEERARKLADGVEQARSDDLPAEMLEELEQMEEV